MTCNAVKAAEISLGKSLAQQLAPHNIRVNSVSSPRASWISGTSVLVDGCQSRSF